MHMQAHISGQVSNQGGPQLPGLTQQNGTSLPSQLQNLGGFHSAMDPEMEIARGSIREKMHHILFRSLQQMADQTKVKDLVKRFEELLFKGATTKEDYMDLSTLESRVNYLMKQVFSNNNRNPQQHHRISSSSVGTMIPTPGMSHSGSLNSTRTAPVDNSMITNGSTGGIHAGSFNASDGSLQNGYQQSPAHVSMGSGGNNLISSMVGQRNGSQMMPTPGFNNAQSSMNSESSNNASLGFSGGQSTTVSQLPPKQYVGSQSNHMLHNLGGQAGIGVRSNVQQRSPSYGFQNRTLNGGLGFIGNNTMQMMNGPASSEGYMTASSYGNSPKASIQQFDQQQRQQQIIQTLSQQIHPMANDGYMNTSDMSGSGNLYGTATPLGSLMNPVSVQSKSKTNSSTIGVNQPNLQAIKQTAHMKPQIIDSMTKLNFQSPHTSEQQLHKFQQQPYLQNPHQFQQQQFVQHQQKQQNQQHQQLLMNNDTFRQSQLASNMGRQETESTETENQFQQNSGAEDCSGGSQILARDFSSPLPQNSQHIQQIVSGSPNNYSCLSVGVVRETGPCNSQSQERSDGRPSHERDIQEEFRQRIKGQSEAQRPRLPSETSMPGLTNAARNTAAAPTSSATACRRGNVSQEDKYFHQVRWLLFLIHSRRCSAPEGRCLEPTCSLMQNLMKHIGSCNLVQCSYPRCTASRTLLEHYKNCRETDCPVCADVRRVLLKSKQLKIFPRPSVGTATADYSMNGSWKPVETVGDAARVAPKINQLNVENLEDVQSGKRMKIEHASPSRLLIGESSPVSASSMSIPRGVLRDSHPQVYQEVVMPMSAKFEVTELKAEPPSLSFGRVSANFGEIKKDESGVDGYAIARPDHELNVLNESAGPAKQGSVKVEKEIVDKPKQEMKQELATAAPAENAAGTKAAKAKIKGVSLTELFTPEQLREHITGLRQWVGQSKAKAEKNQAMEQTMNENSCQLCAVEKLSFEPPPIYCTSCGGRIKRSSTFLTGGNGDTRHYFCTPCYNDARGDSIEVDGKGILKARLERKKNDEDSEEWWVQCDKCEAWQHQICALFNGRRNDGGEAEYTCPNCYIGEIENGQRKPLPQSAVLGAKDLPKTILSDHIEQRLFRRLRHERQERARSVGKTADEVPGAEALVVRVVSSVDKKLEVKQRFLEIFQEENYPTEFPYKSKVVLLFQKIEGVEVCLFGMYVQEFGSECKYPNQRRVYLSYLDSVKYLGPILKQPLERPSVRLCTMRFWFVTVELIAYLEYCKMRGFTSCYIWACPPLKGEDYILYCHPEIQKTPKSDKLREWYLSMLRKAAKENIVVELTNLYDHFFVSTGECKAKVTAARLPYFDGDYWPGAAEDMINQLQQEDDGRRQQKKGKTKRTITKRALKAAGQTDLSANASKDILLMQKLGETICPMKEDFIMVHLQYACSHCCNLMSSGNRWECSQCKKFQLCNKCHDAEQGLEERDRHPISSRDKHALYPVEVTDVPEDTKDKDEILESEFFDTRQAFLSLCQGNHYQYDTLRRAKHSSMMVLYHLHNPTAPAFVTTCNSCLRDIETGQGWRCEICPDFDVCNACYQKDKCVDHPHKLTNHPSTADCDVVTKEARQMRVVQLRKMLDLLVHASQCRYPQCPYPNCRKVKGLFRHGIQCRTRASGGCGLCKKMWYILQLHARACKEPECHVPRCKDLKEHLKRLQLQADSRRRAAVMEMMRQRAAEVAGASG
ncbi:hypothetical protein GIB67_022357 [Kingdonia uniflora]|uniref:histone acetyltransferase n=1 Tax=Kingdonia uniflora TaxID=39325 RepID=A0A7J7N724_9MAGN|nr:hypothetical protein GIB67_022357 [Kingdonia uniflora]